MNNEARINETIEQLWIENVSYIYWLHNPQPIMTWDNTGSFVSIVEV